MKTTWLLAAVGLSASALAMAATDKDAEILKRIQPVGDVYLAGDEPVDAAPAGPRSGDQVYNAVCIACHTGAIPGAPVKGNADDWAPRLEKGLDVLVDHALNGFNAMPPQKAMASEEEIRAAIEFMSK
ncbi:cytochrome c5 family protein [Neiella sp. HB171785]|uniref:Cytochrome c5 family protein n=1 Tax=Neiella litorisoli TaxID=2771431 RepID=A0A8J6QGR0_9GAMM|nr:c-type cytochrome [Neiella litorisoli]MBD1388028.1 cytochrome c5 family protein [Neiella litorisoli]